MIQKSGTPRRQVMAYNRAAPPKTPFSNYFVWDAYARDSLGLGVRIDPWNPQTGQLRAIGPRRWIIGDPWGINPANVGQDFRFREYYEALTDDNRHYLLHSLAPAMDNMGKLGYIPTFYMGRPRYSQNDEAVVDLFFKIFGDITNISFGWDASAVEDTDSLIYDIITRKYPHFNHLIEAWPTNSFPHWDGHDIFMLDIVYRNALAQPANYRPASSYPNIYVAFTNHDGQPDDVDVATAMLARTDSTFHAGWHIFNTTMFNAFEPASTAALSGYI